MVRIEHFRSPMKDTDPSMSPIQMVTVDASFSTTISGMSVAGSNTRQSAFGRRSVWLWLFLLLLPTVPLHAQRMQSTPGPNEFDTAGPHGRGQAGGIRPRYGINYSLEDLRCPGAGAAIVGMRLRRGDVLDNIQIVCATPTCANGACQWTASTYGPSAGNPSGGDLQPVMMCNQNEMVSGFRGRVIIFTVFDYAADIEIQCSTMTSAIPTGGFRVSSTGGHWHQGQGNLNLSILPRRFRVAELTNRISCRPHGGATAVATGVSDFVLPGRRVVQAVSFYCPSSLPTAPAPSAPNANCPTSLSVAGIDNQSATVQQQWFQPSLSGSGGRTAGGSVVTMQAQPTTRNFSGTQISEAVALDPNATQCPVPNLANLCTVGTGLTFTVGDTRTQIGLPNGLAVAWNPPGGHQNSFGDAHFIFDSRTHPYDLLTQVPHPPAGGCMVTCLQTYSCGTGATAVNYQFQIVYTLVHATWHSTILGINNPLVPAKSVTLVTATKH
jgi:hypothetical protein